MKKSASALRMVMMAGAGALLAAGTACSSHSSTSAPIASVSIPETPRGLDPSTPRGSITSGANAPASAVPEDSFVSKTTTPQARDLGDNGGGGGPLTYAQLGAVLQQLQLNPQDQQTSYTVTAKASTPDGQSWTFPIGVSLSKDASEIWIDITVAGPVDKNGTPAATGLAQLLMANDNVAPAAFFLWSDDHSLALHLPINNLAVTPAVLGENLKMFFDDLKASEPVWVTFANSTPSGGGGSGGGGSGGGGSNPFQ